MPLAADVTSNLLRSLKIVQSLGEAVPHGGILKAVAGIGIILLETAERVRQNREECVDIARRAAEHISMLNRLGEDDDLSEDLIERLERYHKVLEEVLKKVERLGADSSWKRTLRQSSVQDETKECLSSLNEAYQMYIFESSISMDNKLTTVVRGMNALTLRRDSQVSAGVGEPSEIPLYQIDFGEEIKRVEKKTYILRIEHGRLMDFTGRRKAVILRRFEVKPEVGNPESGLVEFTKEVGVRGDLLNQHFGRMLGVTSSSTKRTKMIVIEAGTIGAYDYLQSLIGLKYFAEYIRVMCEFAMGYRFLRDHRGSWRGGYQDILLSGRDKRLSMGALGTLDCQWEDSGRRMNEAFLRLTEGSDRIMGGIY